MKSAIRRRRAKALAEKGEKLPRVAAVGLDRARGQSPLARKPNEPRGRGGREIGRGGQGGEFGESAGGGMRNGIAGSV